MDKLIKGLLGLFVLLLIAAGAHTLMGFFGEGTWLTRSIEGRDLAVVTLFLIYLLS